MATTKKIRLQPGCLHPVTELVTQSEAARGPNGEQLVRVYRLCLECERIKKAAQ